MSSPDEADEVGAIVTELLSAITGSPVRLAAPPSPVSGGFSAQIWSIDLDHGPAPFDRPLVLRAMPDRRAGLREAVVQRAVAEAGFPTPAVLASGVAAGLGEAYLVMPKIDGRMPLGGLHVGADPRGIVRLLRALPLMLADASRRLRTIDPQPLRDALQAASIEPRRGGASFLATVRQVADEQPASGFDAVARWLVTHRPPDGPEVICHGDLHPFNLMVDADGGTWVLDWTNAAIAPAEMDIGLTAGFLRCAPLALPKVIAPVVSFFTHRMAERFVTSACAPTISAQTISAQSVSGPSIDRATVDWWEALQHARCLGEAALGRLDPTSSIGPGHPFEIAAPAMRRRLARLTGVTVELPDRVPAA